MISAGQGQEEDSSNNGGARIPPDFPSQVPSPKDGGALVSLSKQPVYQPSFFDDIPQFQCDYYDEDDSCSLNYPTGLQSAGTPGGESLLLEQISQYMAFDRPRTPEELVPEQPNEFQSSTIRDSLAAESL